MSRIACGAAVENILIEAAASGWHAELSGGTGAVVATVRLISSRDTKSFPSPLSNAIRDRMTNRCTYDGLPIADEIRAKLLDSTPALNDVSTHWIYERIRICALAKVIGNADAIMLGEESIRRAFLMNIRFDRPANEAVEYGLSLSSLELSSLDRLSLRMMPYVPGAILQATGGPKLFAAHARKLVESASGLCIVAAPSATNHALLSAGRAMQRAWLTLTAYGFAAQPMMSLMVLANALDHGTPQLIASLGRERIQDLRKQFRSLLPESVLGRPVFLLRFGCAVEPSGRTGRLTPQVNFRAG